MTRKLLLVLGMLSLGFGATAESDPGLIALPWINSLQVSEVYEYRCGRNMKCQVRCSAGAGFEPFEYQNVRRFELARGTDYWLLSAVYIDAVGKGHSANGVLPSLTSCILDDLELVASIPVVDGLLSRPISDDEVIFELQPQD